MTSVPPTQPPAAPETDVRLTEAIERGLRKCRVEDAPVSLIKKHDLFHVTHMVAAELAPLLAERVRVVEGERDALLSADRDTTGLTAGDRAAWQHHLALAESAEAAHRALQAAVEALAAQWDRDDERDMTAGWASDRLRALLSGGARVPWPRDPASPPAVAASTGTSEDVEALAKVLANHQVIHRSIEGPNTSCSGCDWATFTPFGSSAIIAHQAHLATLLAAREAAARAEERERIAQAIEAERDLDPRTPFGLGLASAAHIAREAR